MILNKWYGNSLKKFQKDKLLTQEESDDGVKALLTEQAKEAIR